MSRQVDSDYLRASALSRNGLATRAFTVGTFYHAGTVGVRTNTTKFPGSTALLAHMVRACTHTPFTAVSMLCNVHVRTHRDKYNTQDTLNILIPVTRFQTRTNMDRRREQGPDLSPGGQRRGRKHVVKLPGIEFSPFTQHGTCLGSQTASSSQRTPRTKQTRSPTKTRCFLRALGFNFATSQQKMRKTSNACT